MVAIRPNMAKVSRRWETAFLITGVVVVGLGSAAFGLTRGETGAQPELLDWERSAFSDLGPDDQAIFSALSATAVEIGWLNYDTGLWPPPEELESYAMPPFVRDAFWEQHGEIQWEILVAADITTGGATAYYGSGGSIQGQSAFVLLFQHRHMGATYSNQAEVWVHEDVNAPRPSSYQAQAMISKGWKRVVIFSGADEAARIRG